MIIIKYLFYDFECANCRNMCAKISSFGYVLTNDNFEIIEKKNILINPEANFFFDDKETGELVKVTPDNIKEILRSPKYFEVYEAIKNMLSDSDVIPIGFGNDSDAYFILESNKRYELANYDYKFIDVKDLFTYAFRDNPRVKKMKRTSLKFVTKFYNINFEGNHNSLDDSLAIMEVTKKLMKKVGGSILDFASNANALFDVKKGKVFHKVNGKFIKHNKTIYPDMKYPEDKAYFEPLKMNLSELGTYSIAGITRMDEEDINYLKYKIYDLVHNRKISDELTITVVNGEITKRYGRTINHLGSVEFIVDQIKDMYETIDFEPETIFFNFDYDDLVSDSKTIN